MQTLGMMVRFLHAVRFKHMKGLGEFRIIGTKAQEQATNHLYKYLMEAEGDPEPGLLMKFAHPLMDKIVRTKNTIEAPVACPTDQAACLSLLRLFGNFGMANPFTGWCAMLQHNILDISTHIVRLEHADHGNYVSINEDDGTVVSGKSVIRFDDEKSNNEADQQRSEFTCYMSGEQDDDCDGFEFDDNTEDDDEEEKLAEMDRELLEARQWKDRSEDDDECEDEELGKQPKTLYYTIIS